MPILAGFCSFPAPERIFGRCCEAFLGWGLSWEACWGALGILGGLLGMLGGLGSWVHVGGILEVFLKERFLQEGCSSFNGQ